MKESPQNQRLKELLKSSKIAAGGFMGADTRGLFEIIDADAADLAQLGFTTDRLAARMRRITEIATQTLGAWTKVDNNLQARVREAKGRIPCPWPHPAHFAKRITEVKATQTGQTITWSDLNIHLIAEHGFFEGKNAKFRINPPDLIKILF